MMPPLRILLLIALAVPQTTPQGGAITKFVPPVPTPASFISDEKDVLTPAEHASLHQRILAIQKAGLGDIAVAILPSIGNYSANQVSVEIYRTWKVGSVANIGDAHKDVGVLLLIVPKEISPNNRGECWITTGTGAEGIITDATAGSICRDAIIPFLRKKDYAGAIGAGIGAIETRLRADPGLATPAPTPVRAVDRPTVVVGDGAEYSHPIAWILGGVVALIIAGIAVRGWRYLPRKCPRCGKKMQKLSEKADNAKLDPGQDLEENLGSVDYDVWVCECGESKVVPYVSRTTSYTKCRECHRQTASVRKKIITHPTTAAAGKAQHTFTCRACQATWTTTVTLPRIDDTNYSSGSGGSSWSSSSSSGGSSFGGSGSTSGGGGGSSY